MVKKVLAQYWESKFRDSSYRLLPRAVLPGENPDVTHPETFSAPVQEGSRGGALAHTTGLYLLSTDRLLEDVVEENRQLDSISRGHASLIPRLERENRNMAFAQTHLVSMLRQVYESELQTYKMMDARDKAEEKLRWSEAERRKMAKQMEDLLLIIADRKILETTVSDKVTELETRQRENQDNLTQLLRTVAYYRDKANRLEQTWRLTDAVRVCELQELQDQLPEGSRTKIRKENFEPIPTDLHLHRCPYESLPPAIETPEVLQSLKTVREIFPLNYPEEIKRVLPFRKHPRSE